MATASVTYSWTTGDTVEAAEFNQNYTDLVNFINTNAIQKDGSLAFTAVPTGPATNPTADNHLARKKYVDDLRGVRGGSIAEKAAGWTQVATSGVWYTIGSFTLTTDLTNNHYYEANLFIEDINLNTAGLVPLRAKIIQDTTDKVFGSVWINGGTSVGGFMNITYRWKQSGAQSSQAFTVGVEHLAGGSATISLVGKAYLSIVDLGV